MCTCGMALARKSEYLCSPSEDAKHWYESKVAGTGLTVDLYVIDDWTQDLETVPRLAWSDVMLYMISMPSPFTKEALKVPQLIFRDMKA